MKIMCIGAYPSVSYRGKGPAITRQEQEVVDAAKRELEKIKAQGEIAGTDSAWWRYEFGEAQAVLENIVKTGQLPVAPQSNLMSFHNFDDDGFI